jgi:formylmethanofuran dehydrogenase subunit E
MAVAIAPEKELIDRAVALHGELCPGLATGIQVARLALREVGAHAPNHRVVAVAETDMCGVDAVQALTGCTVGNRNLVMLDYGKLAFQFFTDGRSIRISGRHPWSTAYQAARRRNVASTASAAQNGEFEKLHRAEVDRILSTPPEELFSVSEITMERPLTSTVDPWLVCADCGEEVMETRIRHLDGRQVCVPCYHRGTGRS